MRIAVCSPAYGDTKAQFTYCLANLLIQTTRHGVRKDGGEAIIPDIGMLMASSSNVAYNRQALAEIAVNGGADYIFWVDTDQTFPPDTLQRLFLHMGRAKVAGCNIARRTDPTGPTALKFDGDQVRFVYTDPDKVQRKLVEPVDSMGLGVCLMSTEVFRGLPKPWYAPDVNGEDGYFFLKLRAAGIPILVDHGVSADIGHIGERVFMNTDAWNDRGRWTPPPLAAR